VTNHFHAVDPQGRIHTRNSKGRTYAYTVVVRVGRTKVDRYYAAIEAAGVDAGQSYDRTVDESKGVFPQRELWRGAAALKNWQDFAIEYLKDPEGYGDGRDAAIAKAIAHAREVAEDYEAEGRWDRYENAGWCSRADLAQKLAAQTIGEQVVILDAVVGKPPKAQKAQKVAA
jgi:hypothetical protein